MHKYAPFLMDHACEILIYSLISSKLDNLNRLHYQISDYLLKCLQLVQNNVAQLLSLKKKEKNRRTPVLVLLLWLHIKACIK